MSGRDANRRHQPLAVQGDHHRKPAQAKRKIRRKQTGCTAFEIASKLVILLERAAKAETGEEQEQIHPAVADLLHLIQNPRQLKHSMKKNDPENGDALDLISVRADIFLNPLHSSFPFACLRAY